MTINTDHARSIRQAMSSLTETDLLQVSIRGGIIYSLDQGSSWCLRIGNPIDEFTRQGLPELQVEIEPDQDLYMGDDGDTYYHEWIGSRGTPVEENKEYLSWLRDELTSRLMEVGPIRAEQAENSQP